MSTFSPSAKALGLCSGGLDSILSALLLKRQGINVEWIAFETPFFSSENAKGAAEKYAIPLMVRNITSVYIDMLKNPNCGYGKNMNPCLDCHTLMFKIAGEHIRNNAFDFVFSGEVLGQRPMSQTRHSLRYVEKNSGIDGYILRPLSALNLPATIPEENGLVNRDELLGIRGKSRKEQIELAHRFGVTGYPSPAGGCLLTDRGYCRRLNDLFDHQDAYSENELHLLKYGRHFRIDSQTKIVVGRNKKDNEGILKHMDSGRDILIKMKHVPGPVCIAPALSSPDIIKLAASLCAGYTKTPKGESAEAVIGHSTSSYTIAVKPAEPDIVKPFLLL